MQVDVSGGGVPNDGVVWGRAQVVVRVLAHTAQRVVGCAELMMSRSKPLCWHGAVSEARLHRPFGSNPDSEIDPTNKHGTLAMVVYVEATRLSARVCPRSQ